MRITVVLDKGRHLLDVHPDETVLNVKDKIERDFVLRTIEDKRIGKYLEMKFGGAALRNDWVIQDIGIVSGSVIKCEVKKVEKPKVYVDLAYNNEPLHIKDDLNPITTNVGCLRSILSKHLGIPVSVFTLSTVSDRSDKLATKRELFDCNTLDYYGIELGSKITLDLWDGWNEFILASVSGHEDVVSQFLSWDPPARHFQQRVALYIAAYRGHMGLATAMIKRGAKGHEPVGTYPGRKWCRESEHVESKKCPVHVASERGHLPILRLFVKNSPLCFVVTDHEGRTPIQIALRNRHRDCFEFLIVRQWGRKTGKDISLPVITYCRVLQWMERAKARNLLMNGTNVSTYKGRPPKVGALVGTVVLVDGFSKKPNNSIPFAQVPKPAISPEKLLPALSLTKRRFRAMKQRRTSTRSYRISSSSTSGGRKPGMASSSSLSRATSVSSTKGNAHERELLSSGNMRPLKSCISKKNLFTDSKLNIENENESSIFRKLPDFSAPPEDRVFQHRDSRITFKELTVQKKRSSLISEEFAESFYISQTELASRPVSSVKRKLPPLKSNATSSSGDQGISLPPTSLENRLRPFFYWPPYENVANPVTETLEKYEEKYRGMPSRGHAIQSVAVMSEFTERPWLQQIEMAVRLTKRGVRKNISLQNAALSVNS